MPRLLEHGWPMPEKRDSQALGGRDAIPQMSETSWSLMCPCVEGYRRNICRMATCGLLGHTVRLGAWKTDSCASRGRVQMQRSLEKYVSWRGELPHAKRNQIQFLAGYPGHSGIPPSTEGVFVYSLFAFL